MKTIGLLGGTSWPSTILYYQFINEMVQAKLGGFHSAKLLLKSIDYDPIKSRYADKADEIPDLLKKEISDFLVFKPDCLIICNMTLHRYFDMIKSELNITIPVMPAPELTAQHAVINGYKNLLLLATKATMENGFFARVLEKENLKVMVPNEQERNEVQTIQTALAAGKSSPEYFDYFKSLISQYQYLDGVILACTELPLAITEENSVLPILNPLKLQCAAAVEYAS